MCWVRTYFKNFFYCGFQVLNFWKTLLRIYKEFTIGFRIICRDLTNIINKKCNVRSCIGSWILYMYSMFNSIYFFNIYMLKCILISIKNMSRNWNMDCRLPNGIISMFNSSSEKLYCDKILYKLSILHIVVCICQSQTPSLSPLPLPLW